MPPSPSELLESLQVTPEMQKQIATYPQRGTKWRERRLWMLGSSMFGKASGHMGKGKQRELACQMVWPEKNAGLTGYAATLAQHGIDHEDMVRDMYVSHRRSIQGSAIYADARCNVYETGLVVSLQHGWMGASPDFVVQEPRRARRDVTRPPKNKHHMYDPYIISHPLGFGPFMARTPLGESFAFQQDEDTVFGGGEIKCPAAQKTVLYSEQPQHFEHGFPVQYYDQIQGAMAINGWSFCDAVVHTTQRTEVTRFYFNETYWNTVLFPAVEDFYKGTFLRLLQLRREGALEPGRIDTKPTIPRVVRAKPLQATSEIETNHPDIEDPLAWFSHKPMRVNMLTLLAERSWAKAPVMVSITEPFANFFS